MLKFNTFIVVRSEKISLFTKSTQNSLFTKEFEEKNPYKIVLKISVTALIKFNESLFCKTII